MCFNFVRNLSGKKSKNKERKRNQTEPREDFFFCCCCCCYCGCCCFFCILFFICLFFRPQLILYTSFTGATTQCCNSMVVNRNTQLFCILYVLRSTSSGAVECVRLHVYMCVSLSDRMVSIVHRFTVHIRPTSNTTPIECAWALVRVKGEIGRSFDS